MRDFGRGSMLNNLNIKPHNIVFSYTTPEDYYMDRIIMLEDIENLECGTYLLLEGGHCSCYDFDDTEWCATVYTKDELKKLANAEYNKNSKFWNMVKCYFN